MFPGVQNDPNWKKANSVWCKNLYILQQHVFKYRCYLYFVNFYNNSFIIYAYISYSFWLIRAKKVCCGVHLDPMKQVSESTHIFLWKPFVMWVQNAPSLCLRWLASISIAITCSLWFLVPSLSSPFNSTQKQMQTWVTSTGDLRLKGQWATV